MKTLLVNKSHVEHFSHETRIIEHRGKHIKITYEVANAYENYWAEVFDGHQLHTIFVLRDLGETPNSSAYAVWSATQREQRVNELYKKAVIFIKALLD